MCVRPQAGALSVRDLYDGRVAHEQLHPTVASWKQKLETQTQPKFFSKSQVWNMTSK